MTVWPGLFAFVNEELRAGGPDCQFRLMLALLERERPRYYRDNRNVETVWLHGCYCSHHCLPSAWQLWTEFRPYELTTPKGQRRLRAWLKEHWDALPVRPEMKSHRMLDKRLQAVIDFASYALSERWMAETTPTYDDLWDDSLQHIKYYGRYMAIKYLELCWRTVRPDIPSYDIRAKHAWSPRATLALLFPEHAERLNDRADNSPKTVALSERLATKTKRRLKKQGLEVSYFGLNPLLCNYRKALLGRAYPSDGHDDELLHLTACDTEFDNTAIYRARRVITPHRYLGEVKGWDGLRKDQYERWKTKLTRLNGVTE